MYKCVKRLFDFTLALILLVLTSPVLVFLSFAIYLDLRTNPFFFQLRPGYKSKPFTLIKFKTMTDEIDEKGQLLPDHQRTTILGSILRSFSLDEIPQLINVLRGDMSFVGPRPLLMEYLEIYDHEEVKRHDVRPELPAGHRLMVEILLVGKRNLS